MASYLLADQKTVDINVNKTVHVGLYTTKHFYLNFLPYFILDYEFITMF